MRIKNDNHVVETSNLQNQHKFQISTNDTAFQILSSGLYSDKIMAVIRELCCNAYDANVAVSNGHKPIVVTLPTVKKPLFKVSDIGPGLDHDQIISLYTTYFASDKRSTNAQIGGFGLGSKSPFAYTDSFTVCAKKDGVSRTYSAFISDDGPTITLLGETPTKEANGVEVSIVVKPKDIEDFVKKTELFFAWFDKPVTLINHDTEYVKYIRDYSYSTPRLKLPSNKNNTYSKLSTRYSEDSKPLVVMGGVCYPLNVELVAKHNKLLHGFLQLHPEVHMPIGSVKVAASREELQYDKQTVESLVNVLDEEMENFRNYINNLKQTNTWASKVEASTCIRSIRHSYNIFRVLKEHFNELYPFIEHHTEKMPAYKYDERVSLSIYDNAYTAASIIRDGYFTQNNRKHNVEVKKETGSCIFVNDIGGEKELLLTYRTAIV